MDEENKSHKEQLKQKPNIPVGIIPSNYPKSHRLNSDLPLTPQTPNPADGDHMISKSTPLILDTSESTKGKDGTDSAEYTEIEKKITLKRKTRRGKNKECDDQSADHSKLDDAPDEEPKPRIVLTFRSEKPGLRSSSMKIVSPDEKSLSDESNTKRLTRHRAGTLDNASMSRLDDSDDEKSIGKIRKSLHPNSDSDESESVSPPPSLKRSTRRRSKDSSDTVLANAIARKEKSYEATPTQRLITRPVKPTAKVLANRELKLSVETTNSVRLGSDKSPDEGQPRRSMRRRPARRISEDSFTSPRKQLKQSKRHKSNKDEPEDDVSKQGNNFLSVDEIKQCILGTSPPEARASLKADSSNGNDRERRRFNKLKKKHLSKLGLQAVAGARRNVTTSNENLTDDSTMDSTNTDAIVEHLNAQKKQLEQGKELSLQDETEEDIEEDETCDIDDDEDSELLCLLKEGEEDASGTKVSESDTSDEEFACSTRARPDIGAATPRVTRKAARLQQPHDSVHSDHSDGERVECSSPAGGEEGLTAAAPSESAHYITPCLCTSVENVYITPDALTEPVFCRAVELVNGARVGCSQAAARGADGQPASLRRPSVRVPYLTACPLHIHQMKRHLCCPTCGIFCTQGIFYQCSLGHLFHTECGVWPGRGESDDAPGCPHCGEDPQGGVSLNRQCTKVRVEMRCSNKPIFLPNQSLQSRPALMSFLCDDIEDPCDGPVPAALLPPAPVSLTSLRQRGDAAAADYEELLTSSAEQRLAQAIRSASDAEQVLTRLITGVDLHQHLEAADGGTFLHLAAKHGNLIATYLLHYAGCKLDATDSQLRTPLMVAVLAFTDKARATSKELTEEEARGKSKENVGESRETADEDVLKVMRYLIAAGCDVNFQGVEGLSALHLAAQLGACGACRVLLECARTRVDVRDLGGWTPLVWAAENKNPQVVRMLLKAGADASTIDAEGNSALHWCTLAGCSTSLQLLLDASSPHAIDTANPHRDTPLHVAARQDHYTCVVILLARGGRTDVKNSSGELAVDCARGESRTAISLNMQMSLMARDRPTRHKLLSSDISGGREELGVSCVNELDDAALPTELIYVTRHVTPHYIRLRNTLPSLQGCDCEEECGSSSTACSCCVLGVRRWYAGGRLQHDFPFRDAPMLFECNETCKCNLKQCPNAVITRLSKLGATFVRAQVFRCGEPRGWGLRALTAVPRGAPVAMYCGELLKASQADSRPKDQYMFAMEVKQDLLDSEEEQEPLCVDAGQYGSAARFINHSCRANLAPVRVFTHSRDVRVPNIVLFATTNIAPLEEFTFNYGDKFWSVKSKTMSCCCGAPNCRYQSNGCKPDR